MLGRLPAATTARSGRAMRDTDRANSGFTAASPCPAVPEAPGAIPGAAAGKGAAASAVAGRGAGAGARAWEGLVRAWVAPTGPEGGWLRP